MIFNLAGGSKPEQTKTVTPSTSKQEVTPDSGYALSKVTVNAMTTATQATPSITVSSAGLITASATQTAGYVAAGTKSATKQLTVQAAKTVTPSTSVQTAVASGKYTTGAVKVAAIPSTYKKAATGTFTGNGSNTITISGLSFAPQTIMLSLDPARDVINGFPQADPYWITDNPDAEWSTASALLSGYYSGSSNKHIILGKYEGLIDGSSYFSVSTTSTSVTLTLTCDSSQWYLTYICFAINQTYRYTFLA